jgi:hypothetical protein
MAAELIAGAGALTSAISIAKSLVDLRDEVKRLEHVSELLRKLTAAHEAQSALINRVRELEDENVKLKDWEAEKQKYELKQLPSGAYALEAKEAERGGKPPHYLCVDCCDNGKRAILHRSGNTLHCHAGHQFPIEPKGSSPRRPAGGGNFMRS